MPTAGMLQETYELFGEGYRVSVTSPFGRNRGWVAYRDGVVVEEEFASADMPEDEVGGFYDEAVTFIEALRDDRALKPTIADVTPSVEICISIAESMGSNAPNLQLP
jgi:predicted dehydrogenase